MESIFIAVLTLGLFGVLEGSCLSECDHPYIEGVARVVFGESRGESAQGQLAMAYTLINRVSNAAYPDTIPGVLAQKDKNGNLVYSTLDNSSHQSQWLSAKKKNSASYQAAIIAAKTALCRCARDPTKCAVDSCTVDPCSATNSNANYKATNKIHIGGKWFVCREKV